MYYLIFPFLLLFWKQLRTNNNFLHLNISIHSIRRPLRISTTFNSPNLSSLISWFLISQRPDRLQLLISYEIFCPEHCFLSNLLWFLTFKDLYTSSIIIINQVENERSFVCSLELNIKRIVFDICLHFTLRNRHLESRK